MKRFRSRQFFSCRALLVFSLFATGCRERIQTPELEKNPNQGVVTPLGIEQPDDDAVKGSDESLEEGDS